MLSFVNPKVTGMFFENSPKAYSMTTASEALEFLSSDAVGNPSLRNTWGLHYALAMLIEGLLERVIIPYQTTESMASVSECKGNITKDNTIIQSDLDDFLAVAQKRELLKDYIRCVPKEHIHALFDAIMSLLVSYFFRNYLTAYLSDGKMTVIFAPSVATDNEKEETGLEEWIPLDADEGLNLSWGAFIDHAAGVEWTDATQSNLLDSWSFGRHISLSDNAATLENGLLPRGFSSKYKNAIIAPSFYNWMRKTEGIVDTSEGEYLYDYLPELIDGRLNHAAFQFMKFALGSCCSTLAGVQVDYKIKHVTKQLVYTYEVDREGNVTLKDSTSSTTDSFLSKVSYARGVDLLFDKITDGATGLAIWKVPHFEKNLEECTAISSDSFNITKEDNDEYQRLIANFNSAADEYQNNPTNSNNNAMVSAADALDAFDFPNSEITRNLKLTVFTEATAVINENDITSQSQESEDNMEGKLISYVTYPVSSDLGVESKGQWPASCILESGYVKELGGLSTFFAKDNVRCFTKGQNSYESTREVENHQKLYSYKTEVSTPISSSDVDDLIIGMTGKVLEEIPSLVQAWDSCKELLPVFTPTGHEMTSFGEPSPPDIVLHYNLKKSGELYSGERTPYKITLSDTGEEIWNIADEPLQNDELIVQSDYAVTSTSQYMTAPTCKEDLSISMPERVILNAKWDWKSLPVQ